MEYHNHNENIQYITNIYLNCINICREAIPKNHYDIYMLGAFDELKQTFEINEETHLIQI
jgi:hypothetical protein